MKYILKFILISSLFFTLLGADNINECKTDIYFGNGVWNKQFVSDCEEDSAANCSQDTLNDLIESEIIKNDPKLKAKYGEVKLQYNWGQGAMLDVLETYYQLREAGQVEDYQFFAVIYALTGANSTLTLSAVASQALMEPFTRDWEQGNADEMWQKYYDESFKLSHKVLLISHSQGNLFANRIYDTINPTEYKAYFANLQVASPANEVKAVKGDYVTLFGDPIINSIPGSMDGNANGSPGHAFVSAYLGQLDPYTKIVTIMKQLLPTLDSEISQWQTDQELEKDTINYRTKVKHRFDPSVIMNEEVYPFAPSKKLYSVNGEYVKASCGGSNILASWEGQTDNEFYLLEGTGEEIKLENLIYGPIYMTKVIYEENPPSTIKGKECWYPTYKKRYERYRISLENSNIKKELIDQEANFYTSDGQYVLVDGSNSYYISQMYGCDLDLRECYVTEEHLDEYLYLLSTNGEPSDLNQTITYKYPGYPVGMQYAYSIRTMILDDGTVLYEGYEFLYSKVSAEDAKQQSDSFLGITGHYIRSCESTEFDREFNQIFATEIYGAYY